MSIPNSDMPMKENTFSFSMETPKLGAREYTRVFYPDTGVAPIPHPIIDDIISVLLALHIIKEHKGVFVPGLTIRTGWQYLQNPEGNNQQGGKNIFFNIMTCTVSQ